MLDPTPDSTYRYATSYYTNDYLSAGYNSYLTKSIDLTTQAGVDTANATLGTANQYDTNNINYDASDVSGALGDILQVGNITIDGTIGRISIFDETGTETVRIGSLDD